MMALLRDHGGERVRWSWLNGALGAPCAHAGGLVVNTQTTASWVSELSPGAVRHWATGTAAPCTGLFKPVSVDCPLELGPVPREAIEVDRVPEVEGDPGLPLDEVNLDPVGIERALHGFRIDPAAPGDLPTRHAKGENGFGFRKQSSDRTIECAVRFAEPRGRLRQILFCKFCLGHRRFRHVGGTGSQALIFCERTGQRRSTSTAARPTTATTPVTVIARMRSPSVG